jgi:three-Cys-motif partner protein
MTAVKRSNWREKFYIDLQAGPGKNFIEESQKVFLGSPLQALEVVPHFTRFRFNELDGEYYDALNQRVRVSTQDEKVKVLQGDLNEVVNKICDEIAAIDRPYIKGLYPSFNIAFLDPEGLELEWRTVERLASMKRMDLIINFSTMGIQRTIGDKRNHPRLDAFFGTDEWRQRYNTHPNNWSYQRRELIDFYLSRLQEKFDYYTDTDDTLNETYEVRFKNSRNREVYTLIFASKHPLGDKLWREVAKRIGPPKLL